MVKTGRPAKSCIKYFLFPKGEQLRKYQLFCIMKFTMGVWMFNLHFLVSAKTEL